MIGYCKIYVYLSPIICDVGDMNMNYKSCPPPPLIIYKHIKIATIPVCVL
ncbi:hypothetical protein ISN45_At02g019720 [Arabidopsis thaliana x Arabidopsis arenosa]|uniref:Uncharacterized protein n=2 Tax=Arabidopsis TaxID=3701 RepID=A0A8T2G216_ARASU|nr:hypothetical protein ISN45_At02g019720 [Arabidopsis thaliana x Arabidopsis arenosa]KAG7642049.1 hypothetical protein ISN44_As02g020140 [Arabidopsis suecica]